MPNKSKLTISIIILILLLTVSLAAESRGLKVLKSMVVPGLTQIQDGRNYGYAMLSAEAGIISTLFYFNAEEDLRAQKYYEYAIKFAHIEPGKYDDQYFRNLSRYNSSGFEAGGYNAKIREEAIQLYPNDPIQQQIYIDEHCYPDEYSWNWDSLEHRRNYSKLRIQTRDLQNYGKLTMGVLIVNHIISGIDALRYTSQKPNPQVYLDIKDNQPILMFTYKW
ncbi:MAG: hypothetical protein BWY18_00261 [Candidatus Cloacimonetes bacterium ADurb.Bin211]|nr:MAG: hypothetical protein BWY18_00261 [Candidatus Cloacimonetes bacterium ADurb.Bin211]